MPRPLKGTRLRAAFLLLLFSIFSLGGITFAINSFHKVYYPFGWDDDEGAVWWEAAHVTDLKVLYHPIQQYPYFVVPYPPVFHAVTWVLAKGTGDYLIAGRLICVISALAISLLIALIVWEVSPNKIPAPMRASGAALSALLCFRLNSLNIYLPEMGVDMLALFLSFLGVYLFIRLRTKHKAVYAAYAFFVLALFTKQTMVAAPLACLITDAILNKGRAFRHFLFCLILGLIALTCLSWASNGEVLRHLFIYNASQPFSLLHWVSGIEDNTVGILPIVAIALLSLLPVVNRVLRKGSARLLARMRVDLVASSYRFALFILGFQIVFALVTSITYGKNGSGVHYFLEWNFLCCVLAGLLVVRVLGSWRPTSSYNLGGAAVMLLLFLAAFTGFPASLRRIDNVYRLTTGERSAQDALYSSDAAALKVIEQTPGPVLCENMLLVMKAHKEIPIEPGIEGFLGKAGIWNESGFVDMIVQQKFGVIIMRDLNPNFWTFPVVQAIEDHYEVVERIGDEGAAESTYTVFKPRKSSR